MTQRQDGTVTFRATIPQTSGAIDYHGDCGARLKLDITDDDLADFAPVVSMRRKVLTVTITEEQS